MASAAKNRSSSAATSTSGGALGGPSRPAAPRSVRVMTYNVHGFVGTDRVYDPERTARVIAASQAEIVALQEVDFGRGARLEPSAIERLALRVDMKCHFTITRDGKNGHFGNAVLSKHDLQLIAEGPLPKRRDEGRAVQLLKVVANGLQFHL